MILIVNSSTLEMDYLELPQPGENGITYITYDSTSNSLFALQIVNIIRRIHSFLTKLTFTRILQFQCSSN